MTSLWIPFSVVPCLKPALVYPVFSGTSSFDHWLPVPKVCLQLDLPSSVKDHQWHTSSLQPSWWNSPSENNRTWFKPNSTPLCFFISWLNKQIKDKHNTISYCFIWFIFAGPFLIVTYLSLKAVFGTLLPFEDSLFVWLGKYIRQINISELYCYIINIVNIAFHLSLNFFSKTE